MFAVISFAAIFVFGNVYAGKLPSFINACSYSDSNLNQCIERAITIAGPIFAERGIPELGIEPMDPINLGNIKINDDNLKINFDDTSVIGLKSFKLNSFRINPKSKKALIDFVANVTMKANYNIDGSILFVPIRGKGPSKIKITNLNIIIKYEYDVAPGTDGKNVWVVKKWKSEYKMERAVFNFQNLFGGVKELAATVHRVINENWELVMNTIAPPAVNQIIKSCVDVVKKFYSTVPADELITS